MKNTSSWLLHILLAMALCVSLQAQQQPLPPQEPLPPQDPVDQQPVAPYGPAGSADATDANAPADAATQASSGAPLGGVQQAGFGFGFFHGRNQIGRASCRERV